MERLRGWCAVPVAQCGLNPPYALPEMRCPRGLGPETGRWRKRCGRSEMAVPTSFRLPLWVQHMEYLASKLRGKMPNVEYAGSSFLNDLFGKYQFPKLATVHFAQLTLSGIFGVAMGLGMWDIFSAYFGDIFNIVNCSNFFQSVIFAPAFIFFGFIAFPS